MQDDTFQSLPTLDKTRIGDPSHWKGVGCSQTSGECEKTSERVNVRRDSSFVDSSLYDSVSFVGSSLTTCTKTNVGSSNGDIVDTAREATSGGLFNQSDYRIKPSVSVRNASPSPSQKVTASDPQDCFLLDEKTSSDNCSNFSNLTIDREYLGNNVTKRVVELENDGCVDACSDKMGDIETNDVTENSTAKDVTCEVSLAPCSSQNNCSGSLFVSHNTCDVIRSIDELESVDSLTYFSGHPRMEVLKKSKHGSLPIPDIKHTTTEQKQHLENHILYCGDVSSNASSYERLDESDAISDDQQYRHISDALPPCSPWKRCRQRRAYRLFILLAGFLLVGVMFSVQRLCVSLFPHPHGGVGQHDLRDGVQRGTLGRELSLDGSVTKPPEHPGHDNSVLVTADHSNTRLKREAYNKDFNCFRTKKQKKHTCHNGTCELFDKVHYWCNCPHGYHGTNCEKPCQTPSVGHFPPNPLKQWTKQGAVVVHILIALYMFAAIAQVCDEYFVPALEHICEQLALQADVAGATFMAAGSSAPELATSVIGVFLAKSDMGVGTIVGSSVFNLLFITAACGIFAGMTIELSWYPLTRDSIFYISSVGMLFVFIYDHSVSWWEALILVSFYLVYVITMVFNKKLESFFTTHICKRAKISMSGTKMNMMLARTKSRIATPSDFNLDHLRSSVHEVMRTDRVNRGDALRRLTQDFNNANKYKISGHASNVNNNKEIVEGGSSVRKDDSSEYSDDQRVTYVSSPQIFTAEATSSEGIEVDDFSNPLQFPDGCLARTYWIIVLPLTLLHIVTIPDSRRSGFWRKLYPISFLISVFYIALYSYIMVWMCTIAGHTFHIPETVTGLTILAAGTSVPDCLASVYVARDGYGDMAVSNAIGSNVFDILLGLGIPWLIDGLIQLNAGSDHHTEIGSSGIKYAAIVLLGTVIYLWVSLKLSKWFLTVRYGIVTMCVYALVIGSCIFIEFKFLDQLDICDNSKPSV